MIKYEAILPIENPIRAHRQSAKRHYGVHPYFTRRPANVVRDYILHYSQEGDKILDPFGGSGVVPIEAYLENRIGIQNDINPFANFIAGGIADLASGSARDLRHALVFMEETCAAPLHRITGGDAEFIQQCLEHYQLPPDTALPATADAETYRELFTSGQLASLAILKDSIQKIAEPHSRSAMLLAWSATLGKLNKTFLSAEGRAQSRGGSSIFSIYRYKIAAKPIELPAWATFYERAMNVLEAKAEIDFIVNSKREKEAWIGGFETYGEDVEALGERLRGKIDYIFTDPPYGAHIAYVDLSTLWNTWLGLTVSDALRKKELIVGGALHLTEEVYIQRLYASMQSCVGMLKDKRWMSVVFQHWNPLYFQAILEATRDAGCELRAAISQVGDPIWSMHKKKNKESVLAGEMILTFFKSGSLKMNGSNGNAVHFDVEEALDRILKIENTVVVHGELIFNRLIIDAWKNSALGSLHVTRTQLCELIENRGWRYDERHHHWTKSASEDITLFS